MSQENVDLVRKAYDALNGGIEGLLPFHPPDVVMYSIAEWPDDPVYRGHDGVRKLTAAWTDNFDNWGFEVHEIREEGNRVLAHAEMTGRIKDTGIPIRQPLSAVFSNFREGMIGEVRFFLTWQEALKAVGLAAE